MASKVDPIQELHDIALQQGFEPPTYEIFKTDNNSFKCLLNFFTYSIEAMAPKEDESLIVCCTNMLIFLKCPDEFKSVCTKELNITIHYDDLNKAIEDKKCKKKEAKFKPGTMTPVSFLYEYAARYNDKSLEFTDVMTSDGKYSVVCRFKEKVVESEFMVSKKNTKHNAALNMIRLIGLDIPAEVKPSYADMNQDYKKTNYIGILQNLAIKQKETPPLYELDNESSPQEFKFKCSYKKITLTGCGKSKQEAKSAAAALVLSQLQSG